MFPQGGDEKMVEKVDWPLIGMTLDEAAAALRVERRTVQKAILDGKIPARKVGVGWRIDPDAIKAWLASGNAKAEAKDE